MRGAVGLPVVITAHGGGVGYFFETTAGPVATWCAGGKSIRAGKTVLKHYQLLVRAARLHNRLGCITHALGRGGWTTVSCKVAVFACTVHTCSSASVCL